MLHWFVKIWTVFYILNQTSKHFLIFKIDLRIPETCQLSPPFLSRLFILEYLIGSVDLKELLMSILGIILSERRIKTTFQICSFLFMFFWHSDRWIQFIPVLWIRIQIGSVLTLLQQLCESRNRIPNNGSGYTQLKNRTN